MSSKQLVLVLDRFGEEDLGIEAGILGPVQASVSRASNDPERLNGQLAQAVGLLTEYTRVDAELFRQTPQCRAVVTYTTGHDQVDLDAARERGIVVANIPGHCTEEVADHTMALTLALCRGLPRGDAIVRSGRWGTAGIGTQHRLRGRTLGLVGFGRIGREVASRGRAFGFRILAFDPGIARAERPKGVVHFVDDLQSLLRSADVVSLHVPLLPETEQILDRKALSIMKAGSFLVNTSRGGLVDLPGLIDALDNGPLAGAGLDAFPEEPPDISTLDRPDLILTPHMAYYSTEAMEDACSLAARAMAEALSGRDPVNRLV